MDIGDIIKDAVYYPINDKNRFFNLAMPNIILGVLLGISIFLTMGYYIPSYSMAELFYMMGGLFMIISIIVAIVVLLIDSGISIDVIRNSINNQNILPELDVKNNITMGLKSFVVTLAYMIVPFIIYLILVFVIVGVSYYSYNSATAALAIVVTLVLYILMFIIGLVMPVILGKLAMTNSIGEAVQLEDIWNRAKQIGFLNLFLLMILITIISGVLSFIGTFISLIPIIGYIITIGIIYTYIMLFVARCYGLIFNNHLNNQNQYPTNQYNNPQYNQFNSQQYNQFNTQNPNQQFNQFNTQEANQNYNQGQDVQQNNNPLDFNNTQTNVQTKTCIACGYVNAAEANICNNCGNKL